jgi:two-component system NtrC family sensor kinase
LSIGMNAVAACRVLMVDDNVAIHADFRKVLFANTRAAALNDLEQALFGGDDAPRPPELFEASYATSGEEACELVKRALGAGLPLSIAVVDMRMPGWDGLRTVEELWAIQPELEVALTSAYMDYSWKEVITRLGRPGLRLIPKPWTSARLLGVLHELRDRVARGAGSTPLEFPKERKA